MHQFRENAPADSSLHMYPLLAKVREFNEIKLGQLAGQAIIYHCSDNTDITWQRNILDEVCPRRVLLKEGAPVMLTHVCNTAEVHRGMRGVIVTLEPDWVQVCLTSGIRVYITWTTVCLKHHGVKMERTQMPVAVAWATTVHKAQGATLASAGVDLGHIFESGMGYVAMSRVASSSALLLLDPIERMSTAGLRNWARKLCKVDDVALQFYMKMLPKSEQQTIERERSHFHKILETDVAWQRAMQQKVDRTVVQVGAG